MKDIWRVKHARRQIEKYLFWFCLQMAVYSNGILLNPDLEKVHLQLTSCSPVQGDIHPSGWLLMWDMVTSSINGSLHGSRVTLRKTRCSGSNTIYSFYSGRMYCYTITKEMVLILTLRTPAPSQWRLWYNWCNSIQLQQFSSLALTTIYPQDRKIGKQNVWICQQWIYWLLLPNHTSEA